MTQQHETEHHPIRNTFIGAALIVLTAVVLINVSPPAQITAARCSITNPGFTCTFMRMSTGDFSMVTSTFVFTSSFWLTLGAFSIPVIAAGLLTKRAYRGSGS